MPVVRAAGDQSGDRGCIRWPTLDDVGDLGVGLLEPIDHVVAVKARGGLFQQRQQALQRTQRLPPAWPGSRAGHHTRLTIAFR
jgi:hypothetical protein